MPQLDGQGARLFYQMTGESGPVVLLIHGGGCTHHDWHAVTANLASDHRVLVMDLLCHGASTGTIADCAIELWAADVNRLITHLSIAPAVLVGHSLASRIVIEAALQHSSNCRGLVLLDGSRVTGGFAATAPAPDAPPRGAPTMEQIITEIVGPHAEAAVNAHVLEAMTSHTVELLMQSVAAYQAWDSEHADAALAALPPDLPMLAVQSTYHDNFTPRTSLTASTKSTPYLDFLRQARPDLAVHILPEVGHFSMLEKPLAVARLIRDFCAMSNDPAVSA